MTYKFFCLRLKVVVDKGSKIICSAKICDRKRVIVFVLPSVVLSHVSWIERGFVNVIMAFIGNSLSQESFLPHVLH